MAFLRSLSLPYTLSEFSIEVQVGFHHFLSVHLSATISHFLVPYFHLYLTQALSLLLSSSFSHTLSHNLFHPSLFPSILLCKYIYLSLSVSACSLHSLSIFFSQTSLSLASLSLLNFHTRQNIALSYSISLKISLSNGNRGTVPGYVKISAGGERDDEAGDKERDRTDVSLLRGGGLRGLRRLRELGAGEYSHRVRLLRALLARRPGQPLHRHPPRRRVSGTLPRERNTRKALSLSPSRPIIHAKLREKKHHLPLSLYLSRLGAVRQISGERGRSR